MTKPINFRPTENDQAFIDAVIEKTKSETTADVIRWGIFLAAVETLGDDVVKDIMYDIQQKK